MTRPAITPAIVKALTGVRITPTIGKALTGGRITPTILEALAGIEYDEADQHDRSMAARRLVCDDIDDGRIPDRRLITTALACACPECLDVELMVEQAREFGQWLSESSPVERFVAECCERTPGSVSDATPAEFLAAYVRWAGANGESTNVTAVGLGRELMARFGVRSVPRNGVRTYAGLTVLQ
ncbi:hypothetical protein ACT17_02805 [Mycolicibacterium conceptionense]|jgi:hypothetical protein|uniref:Uncharacterized protein n=2 Tax=Mycolicibacterium TaxID=1866885 RepID=A0ABR5FN27_9MYCO|nr:MULTISPECIES: hypothetical protein [Mycolicibacterium]KLI07902.1 hypothetical protein AA982_12400 [Mycolicibacterium senegalense]KLO48236.1 hypothetical protein ABW05_26335 [Mycolicibacterium senegalense]KMV20595.1 hypothetical protein ACT17_02805 [Mycolicibacterium conceptionense]OBJ97087.1 hypothetical protein A5639_30660 [Mycolicibacterium conceptionense]OMB68188.1 hypothetical protein A5741_09875 [Mycolicibacterium conceptionense]